MGADAPPFGAVEGRRCAQAVGRQPDEAGPLLGLLPRAAKPAQSGQRAAVLRSRCPDRPAQSPQPPLLPPVRMALHRRWPPPQLLLCPPMPPCPLIHPPPQAKALRDVAKGYQSKASKLASEVTALRIQLAEAGAAPLSAAARAAATPPAAAGGWAPCGSSGQVLALQPLPVMGSGVCFGAAASVGACIGSGGGQRGGAAFDLAAAVAAVRRRQEAYLGALEAAATAGSAC